MVSQQIDRDPYTLLISWSTSQGVANSSDYGVFDTIKYYRIKSSGVRCWLEIASRMVDRCLLPRKQKLRPG